MNKARGGSGSGDSRAQGRAQTDRLFVWLSISAIVLIPLIFYSRMILGGREPAASPDAIAVVPLGIWAREATRSLGAIPLWIPHIFSGMPSYGSYTYTPASPLSPLNWIMQPFASERGIRYFLLFLLGGLSGYAFFRRQGASAPAAAAAALGFVMSAYVPGVIEAGHSTKLRAMMHVPLVLLALDIFLDRPRPLAAAFLALAAAMLGWSNHPQILYYAIIIGVLYAGGRIIAERRLWSGARLARAAGWAALSGTTALFLVAEPTLAVREYAPYSIRGATEGGGAGWEYATAWSFSPKETVSLLFPEFFGLKGDTYFGPLPFTQSTHYFGITALLLGIIGFVRRRDARSWIWLVTSGVILFVGFGNELPILYGPFYKLLPYFNKFRVPSMFYSLLPFAFGYLVARGIDTLSGAAGGAAGTPATGAPAAGSRSPAEKRRGDEKRKRALGPASPRAWYIAAGIAAAIAFLALVIGTAGKSSAMSGMGWTRPEEAGRIAASQLAELRAARWDMRIASIVRSMLLVAVLLAAVPSVRRLRRPAGAALLGAILIIDLAFVGAKFLETASSSQIEATAQATPEIDFLKSRPGFFRILPVEDFTSNRYAASGISSVGGYQPAKLRIYQDLVDQRLLATPSVLSMLNVKYILSSQNPGHPSFTPAAPGVWAFDSAMPRAWFVPSWRALPDEDAVLRAIGGRDFDPSSAAFFSRGRAPALPSSGLPVRDATVEADDPRVVRIRVGDGEPGLLVVSEIYYPPGWKATIDGKAVPILQANHVLRAIEVPAGPHVVEMRSGSRAYREGRILDRIGGIALVLLAGIGYALDRRGRKGSPQAREPLESVR